MGIQLQTRLIAHLPSRLIAHLFYSIFLFEMVKSATFYSTWKVWLLDPLGRPPPDLVYVFEDPNNGVCQSTWQCDIPCGASLAGDPNSGIPPAMSMSQDCGRQQTIQEVGNDIYGNTSYVAVGKLSVISYFYRHSTRQRHHNPSPISIHIIQPNSLNQHLRINRGLRGRILLDSYFSRNVG